MKQISIHGFKVQYEDNAQEGINYLLYDLDRDEAMVFFDQAKLRRYSRFEDEREGQYTLSYNSDGSYTLIKRG